MIAPAPTKEKFFQDEASGTFTTTWFQWFQEASKRLTGSYDYTLYNEPIADPIPNKSGVVYWNTVDGTLDVKLYNGVTLQVGQELHFYGKASGAISNGDLCQFAGVQGDHILIKKVVPAEIIANPHYLVGVATQTITSGEFGYTTWFGKVNDIFTTGWSVGDILYFDNSTGQLTNVEPLAPNRRLIVASVIKLATGASENGIIIVRPTFDIRMMDLNDVDGVAPSVSGQVLVWDNTHKYWIPGAAFVANLGTVMTFPTTSATIARTDAAQSFTGAQTFATVDINGGAIDGTPIGASSASSGSFTTLAASSTLSAASISTTGTLVGGSISTTGTLVGGSISTTGTLSCGALTASSISTTGTISASNTINTGSGYYVNSTKVVGARVSDSRANNTVGTTWDANAQGLLDAVRDALISHGLLSG
jgi:hypothetical protein